MIDLQGRKINYLRLSVTDRCNLRCKYCMPEEGISKMEHSDLLSLENLRDIVGQLTELGIEKVRITGGEPLVRQGIVSLVAALRALKGIREITMTTNGILLKEAALPLKSAGLTRVNISLDSLKEDRFSQMTRGGSLDAVLEGIQEAIRVGLSPIKINVVLIKGFNDDEIENFVKWTYIEPVEVRFIELMPIGEVATWSQDQFMSNLAVLEKMPELLPIEAADPSSPAVYYQLPGAKGKVGLISPISCKFCNACNRIRLTATGKLKTCLHSEEELDLKPFLNSPLKLRDLARIEIASKPKEHQLENGVQLSKNMVEIGG